MIEVTLTQAQAVHLEAFFDLMEDSTDCYGWGREDLDDTEFEQCVDAFRELRSQLDSYPRRKL
jgi:hypothetical protein